MKQLQRLLRHDSAYLLLFIFLVALNLRGPVTSLSPLFERISLDLSLSSSQSGLLSSLPLLAFAFFAPLAAWLSHRFQIERVLAIGVGFIALGMVTRAVGFISTLYLGVILIGVGIAIGNVLLPSLLKRHFPNNIVQFTGIYVLMMNVGGFLMASSAVPLSLFAESESFSLPVSSWSFSLACQALIVAFPLAIWFSGKIPINPIIINSNANSDVSIWRSTTAWQVSSFLAMNSLISYSVMAWIPSILMSSGYTDATAGLYQGYLQLAGALPSLILTPFMHRLGSSRQLCLFATGLAWISIMGYLFAPSWSGLWSIVFGFGTSMTFILGLSFISFRTNSPKQAAALSGMSQLIGYTLAAIGPFVLGFLHDRYDSWQQPLYLLLTLCSVWILLGWIASPKPKRS